MLLAGWLSAVATASPLLDKSFGANGFARIRAPAGFEDKAYASTLQPDGKLLVAGITAQRGASTFITRFRTNGSPDPTFGSGGSVLLSFPDVICPTCLAWAAPVTVDVQPDGSVLLVGVLANGFVLARVDPAGAVDRGFGAGGSVVVVDNRFARNIDEPQPIRAAIQPDGGIVVVTDASANGAFVLRLRRFKPDGTVDPDFGNNGVKELHGLPRDFSFSSARLAVVEPEGGFTLVASATINQGTYLLLRLRSDGALDETFGGVGYVSGYDVGNPGDIPAQMIRLPNGRYALTGFTSAFPPFNDLTPDEVIWEVDRTGKLVRAFGNEGRTLFPNATGVPRYLAPMADGGIATAQFVNAAARITRLDASGNPDSKFGNGGTTIVAPAGYLQFRPVGIHVDSSGRVTTPGWGNTRDIIEGDISIEPKGLDVLVASLTPAGALRSDFGRADGIAVWDNPGWSYDRIDTITFDHSERIVLAGFSDSGGRVDHLLARLTRDGSADLTFGSAGRVLAHQPARRYGPARAVLQGGGRGLVVVNGDSFGATGRERAVVAFRADSGGVVDPAFRPALEPAGAYAQVGLAARPDGRLVYGAHVGETAFLQQLLPDGTPDRDFGVNGTIGFTTGFLSYQSDLVILNDGSIVLAVFSYARTVLYKVDAFGRLEGRFGVDGVFTYPGPGVSPSAARLFANRDGSFVAVYGEGVGLGQLPTGSLTVLRISAAGQLISARRLLVEDNANFDWTFTALADSSLLIARTRHDSFTVTTALFRLLPDDRFDRSFGAGGAFALEGITAINAMAIDADGRLVLAGRDATSAVVARFVLSGSGPAVDVVEYFNPSLGHYFITASTLEMANIESGGAGPGWKRTGNTFGAGVAELGVPSGTLPVCRFYGTPGRGPNSHFYTVSASECAGVRQDPGWTYEGVAFYMFAAADGQCAAGQQPVYRAYNNRFAENDSNHRYSTQLADLQALAAQGWSIEGVAFCSPAG